MTDHAHLSNEIEVTPAFYDVDPMSVVWHGHYVKYFELARSALMSKFDYDYHAMRESGFFWPIVDMRIKFVRPAALKQLLKVKATITEFESRLRVDYRITSATGDVVTKGHTIQVAVDANTMEMQWVCPKILWDKLGVSP
ncbi:MAG: acyl-CoA thioesterase [Archangium sp.]